MGHSSEEHASNHDHLHRGCNHDHGSHHHAHGGHGHHGHSHAQETLGSAFAIGISLNILFVLFEAVFGFLSGSLALLADAGHNLGDVLSLAMVWGAIWLSQKKPTQYRTYGYARSSIYTSLLNAILLLIAIGVIAWEAIERFRDPAPIDSGTVLWVALLGIVINGATALLFLRGKDHDINIRGAYLHMAADAGVSLGVVIAALLMGWTGWLWLDPAVSLMIVVVIAWGTFGLFRESVDMAMDAVPNAIDLPAVRAYLLQQDDVVDVHDLHIWPLSTTSVALTAHVVRSTNVVDDAWHQKVSAGLKEKFGIDHPTVQLETLGGADLCRLAPDRVV